jgi:hypothetical protein
VGERLDSMELADFKPPDEFRDSLSEIAEPPSHRAVRGLPFLDG